MKRFVFLTGILVCLCIHLNAQVRFSIIGNSYSTFKGDVATSSNRCWYPDPEYSGFKCDVTSKDLTWYRKLASKTGWTLDKNEAYSGSFIRTKGGYGGANEDVSSSSFVTRMTRDLGSPNVIFVFGGTNDSWADSSDAWLGSGNGLYAESLKKVIQYLLDNYGNSTEIYVLINSKESGKSSYQRSSLKRDGLSSAYISKTIEICKNFQNNTSRVKYIQLSNIEKREGHPNKNGMEAIATQVADAFTHKLNYVVDGNSYKSSSVIYGKSISQEAAPTKEGYTFSGWSGFPSDKRMPNKDLTVSGSFSVNSYNLIYKVDGETYKTVKVAYGTKVSAIAAPEKTGYTFSGWSGVPTTMPAKDVTVTGTFTPNKHTLTYKVDGEVYGEAVEVAYGTAITLQDIPVKEGHTFSGWSGFPESGTMPDADVTVTGCFSYYLTYQVDGEAYGEAEELAYGATITPKDAPTKEGHTFSGWTGIPESGTMPAADLTVTGTFTPNKHTLTYQVDGAAYGDPVEVAFGTTITPIADPVKDGRDFSGWSGLPESGIMPDADLTITGTFKYKLIYQLSGIEVKTEELYYGSPVTLYVPEAMSGYAFSGWDTEIETMPAEDVTVIGSYIVNKHTLTYLLDGVEVKKIELSYGAPVPEYVLDEKEGHTFSGWSEIPSTMPDEDITITGCYTYKLIYQLDGVDVKTEDLYYGTTITPYVVEEKTGYTFSGWDTEPETMPAENVTVIGSYNVNKHTLTYQLDGVEVKKIELDYGAPIPEYTLEEKEGHTFSGWSEIPSTMPDEDVTITGCYTYKLTYQLDGVEVKSEDLYYGTTITPYVVEEKSGYTFSGWDTEPETMPAENVVVAGSYLKKTSVTIPMPAGQVTYYSEYDLDFTTLEKKGVKAYVATGYDKKTGTIWLSRVNKVPAQTGILIMGTSDTYEIPIPSDAIQAYYKNLFVGNLSETVVYDVDGEYSNYYLSKSADNGLGFYHASSSGTQLPKNRCYLHVPTSIPTVGVEGVSEAIPISSVGQVSYYSTESLDFTDYPDLKAYTAIGYEYDSGTIWLSRAKQVPANTGFLLMGAEDSYNVSTTPLSIVYANMLKGHAEATTITTEEDGYINYYLSNGQNGLGYYKVKESVALSQNRSYLQIIPQKASSRTRAVSVSDMGCHVVDDSDVISLKIYGESIGGDENNTTDISTKCLPKAQEEKVYYNLNGQRVDNPGKGLFILNGKKILIN